MVDEAIGSIGKQPAGEVDFTWFRETFRADNGLKDSLAYGHAVIDTVPKLDQYLYTYGPMIENQWQCVAEHLSTIERPVRLIDYGCGQGLAGLLLNDLTGGSLLASVRQVLLIEPSTVSLARAKAIYAAILPASAITAVAKRFDVLEDRDVRLSGGGHTLHVFSNSLDVSGFKSTDLLARTLTPGKHTIFSISHDRDFDGGTPKIEQTKQAVKTSKAFGARKIIRSTLDAFTCTVGRRSKGIVWLCELEVHDS